MKIAGIDASINSSGVVVFELDDDLNVIDQKYMGFSSVKKNTNNNIHHYSAKDFNSYIHKNEFMISHCMDFIRECEYVAIEDYAYGKSGSAGLVFHIAEFCGAIKRDVVVSGKKLRAYEPTTIKMFGTLSGNADKYDMYQSILEMVERQNCTLNFQELPLVDKRIGVSPTSDIVDAWWIATLLTTELKLRKGLIELKNLHEKQIQVFNKINKNYKTNLLDAPFF